MGHRVNRGIGSVSVRQFPDVMNLRVQNPTVELLRMQGFVVSVPFVIPCPQCHYSHIRVLNVELEGTSGGRIVGRGGVVMFACDNCDANIRYDWDGKVVVVAE